MTYIPTPKRCRATFPHDGVRLGCLLARGHANRHKTQWVVNNGDGLVQFWIWWKELQKPGLRR